MAFDGITTKAVITELQQLLIGGKINKVFQPMKNEIILSIYHQANYMLLLSVNPDTCRIHLTNHTKPNPQNAPNFCMLLRKYLIGAKIIDISTYDLERTVQIKFECYNELNDLIVRKLFIPIMNRQSNIILTNENNMIIDSLKHTENYLPAHPFEFANITKTSFLKLPSADALISLANGQNLLEFLPNTFIGFSKTFIKSILEALQIDEKDYSDSDLIKIYHTIHSIISHFGTNQIGIKPFEKDYSIVFEPSQNASSINEQMDTFYYEKEQKSVFITARNNLLRIVSSYLKKVYRKLENMNHKLKECENMDTYRIYGELLTANLYQINATENLSEITVNNYYTNTPTTIPLDRSISIHKNIEKYFKKYNKLKNALLIVNEQKKEAQKELEYIESIVFSLENAKSMQDIEDVYSEIAENLITKKDGWKKQKGKICKKNAKEKQIALQSVSIDGFTVYIGKNNVQNDYLSLKFANKNDIWFHAQKIHGSHVLLRNPENVEIPEKILLQCAELAKENSKAKNSSNVPVDYCKAKYVKKSPHAKPRTCVIY